ncbi:tyrosine-type recombinase/integrase [Tropicibacter sp. R16_0]|uniref:tyrosine-type recombinase/integrase n=1 Tax=Tropicibacter sp. R16_0 TaxID=2821102 RepID=UPI001ADA0A93|nr:site-specific integrase [Tropicibacter sp. R16_0]MBO9448930.1 tyrosine-type recombinase/integrase [Tropicibacter sp. R16_0]
MRITEASIKKLLPAEGRKEIPDDEVRGLLLRGNRTGASWVLRFRDNGERRRHTVGRWPGVSVADARRAARKVLGEVAMGKPPERREATLTLAEALDRYEPIIKQRNKSARQVMNLMRREYRPLMNRELKSLTKADFLRVSDSVRKTRPPTADLLLRVTKPFLNWAAERAYGSNVLADVRVAQTAIRDNHLTVEQAREVFAYLRTVPYPFGPAFSVLLLAGGRRTEVLEMRKSELDLDAAVWTIPGERMKNGLPRRIPLAPVTVEIIKEAIDKSPKGDFVFSTSGKRASLGVDKAVNAMRERTGNPHLNLHDFRRTVATALSENGADVGTVDRLLNHAAAATNSRLARIYNKSDMLEARRQLAEQWADMLQNPDT